MTLDLQLWAKSVRAFADWISIENQAAGRAWSKRLNSEQHEQVESAVAEAVVWDFISCRSELSYLNEVPGKGGIDFRFMVDGHSFLVEVTNISTEAASSASGMPDKDRFSGNYGWLTKKIRQKIRDKLDQARSQSDLPLLVAVTTLHRNASRACISRTAVEFAMGSPPNITGNYNPNTGIFDNNLYLSTDLEESVFLSPHPVDGPDGLPIAQAKYQPISGFLVGGFGLAPEDVCVLGALNPVASRPFDPAILSDISFCSFLEWPVTTTIAFNWTISESEDRERQKQAAEHRLRASGQGELLDEYIRRCGADPGAAEYD